jgi:hypothetical protein
MSAVSTVTGYVIARLGEASTYAGVAAILASLGFNIPTTVWGAATQVGVALAGLLAVVLPASLTGRAS